jgi:hypothetical protein
MAALIMRPTIVTESEEYVTIVLKSGDSLRNQVQYLVQVLITASSTNQLQHSLAKSPGLGLLHHITFARYGASQSLHTP